ncbi:LysR substrate-binding domain-containing protein [Rhodoferax aquaticus]|uniref:LysR family transcriptional regulator n=1 Tax=Rhodoferax aquaticus TaxID=2527691 RepID=A0A515ELT4_9BURK|nr:LysR substrate-binding domain-containing protein [Rhodoferax aquaticus]QDL53618.1 LysR family transcriptional regulator [Rhodoferax aquaticus]
MTPKTLPSLAALQSFEAAARLGSFTKAAVERKLTHSAISRNIQSVEHWCGETLFDRKGPKVLLSASGQRLRQRLSEPLQALHAALELEEVAAAKQPLKVLMLSSIACTWLVPLLPAFARACPQVQLSVETGYEIVSLPPLQPAVAIRFGHFARAGLRCQRLWFDRLVAVASPDWVVQHGSHAAQWPAHQLLRHSHEPWPARLTVEGLGTAPVRLTVADGFEFNDALLLAQAALMGCGVAWVRESLVQGFVSEGRLQVLARSEQVSDKAVWLVCREDTADLGAVRAFFAWATRLS